MDTGSLRSDFITPEIAELLIQNEASVRKTEGAHRCQVCTPDGCTLVDTVVTFNLVFLNEVTNTNHYIAINAWVHPK